MRLFPNHVPDRYAALSHHGLQRGNGFASSRSCPQGVCCLHGAVDNPTGLGVHGHFGCPLRLYSSPAMQCSVRTSKGRADDGEHMAHHLHSDDVDPNTRGRRPEWER